MKRDESFTKTMRLSKDQTIALITKGLVKNSDYSSWQEVEEVQNNTFAPIIDVISIVGNLVTLSGLDWTSNSFSQYK